MFLDILYRNAVIMEALRIHPSTGLMFERYVPPGGVVLHGKFIPGGTTIGVNAWVLNRDRNIFGDDSDVFRPERWVESKPERLKEMRKWMFTVSDTNLPDCQSMPKFLVCICIQWLTKVFSIYSSSVLDLAPALANT